MGRLKIVEEYFNFSRRERIGIAALVLLIILVAILPRFVANGEAEMALRPDTALARLFTKVREDSTPEQFRERPSYSELQFDRRREDRRNDRPSKAEMFYFDPNTVDEDGWRKLGLRDRTITTILRFRSKGGRFRSAEDLGKIYGLRDEEFRRLEPYVRIAEEGNPQISRKESAERWEPRIKASPEPVDINLADTSALIALPGIGSKLANRIVNFREKLGGFHSIEQLREVYGIRDSVFDKLVRYLKLENPQTKKINLNTATLDEMKVHPYIKYQLAKAIVAYREEHGDFSTVDGLRAVRAVTEQDFERIKHYVFVE